MTATATRTIAFTVTDARYVGAKIGADLRLLNGLYGRPTLASIDDYAEEAALLLRDGYLGTIEITSITAAPMLAPRKRSSWRSATRRSVFFACAL